LELVECLLKQGEVAHENELKYQCDRSANRNGDYPFVELCLVAEVYRVKEDYRIERMDEARDIFAEECGDYSRRVCLLFNISDRHERARIMTRAIERHSGNKFMESAFSRRGHVWSVDVM